MSGMLQAGRTQVSSRGDIFWGGDEWSRVIVILLAQDPIKTSGMGNASSWAS